MKMNETTQGTVSAALEVLAVHCHDMAREKGFWDDEFLIDVDSLARYSGVVRESKCLSYKDLFGFLNDRNDAELLMLMVTELAEACEGLRHGNGPSEHIPEFSCLEEELADTIIRILDMAAARNCRIGEAVIAKMKYNAGRPDKHGKKF